MKGFDSKFIDELKAKNDIIDVAGKYLQLKPNGTTYWARCPFHHEKTASFAVSSVKQIFHCFGCGKSGDVITFIEEMESLDFNDAVKFLAERAHLPLPEVRIDDEKIKEEKRLKERLYAVLKDTALFYVNNLKTEKAEKHIEYVLKRKFTGNTVTRFGIGASFNFGDLPQYLKSKGYSDKEIVLSGACGEKNGRLYDWLGGRLIIPVIDTFNRVIAFDGRRIDGIKEQKYINTKETGVFIKGKTLFNLNNVKRAKTESGIDGIIIVEGHLDVVSLSQAGFNNVVASMGTALTKDQARAIKRFTDKVYICYDGDGAGKKATLKGLDVLEDEGLEVKVVIMPEGFDPDEVIVNKGAGAYAQLLKEALPLIDYKIKVLKEYYDLKSIDGRRKFVSSALKVIKTSNSATEQEDLLKTVRDLTGVTFEALKRELYSLEDKPSVEISSSVKNTEDLGDRNKVASRFILYSYLNNKPYALETDINDLEFEGVAYREIKDYIKKKMLAGEEMNFNDIFELLGEEDAEEKSKITELFKLDQDSGTDMAKYFADCVRTVKADRINKEIGRLKELFNGETDTEKRSLIAKEISELILKKNRLY